MDQLFKSAMALVMFYVVAHMAFVFLMPDYMENPDAALPKQSSPPFQASVEDPARKSASQAQSAEIEDPLPARAIRLKAGRNGHFHLKAKVNGATIPFLVDTGASYVSLNYDDARRAGIRLKQSDFKYATRTANGIKHVAVVTLDVVRYKGVRVRNVKAAVSQKGALGSTNLLGNSFLSRLREYKVQNGTLTIRP